MTWIKPDNVNLSLITGFSSGLGLNPWPSFDWANITFRGDPLVLPAFTMFNYFFGMFMTMFMVIGIYYSNVKHAAYLPIIDNGVYDNQGGPYNTSRIIDAGAIFNATKYEDYSMPYMSAGNMVGYFWFLAAYIAGESAIRVWYLADALVITYAALFHHYEIAYGFKYAWRSFKRKFQRLTRKPVEPDDELELDIHTRRMRKYKEAPEWWYLILLVISLVLGMVGVGAWKTYTTPAVVLLGYALSIVFIVPVGIIYAVSGQEVSLNVIGELIGGAIKPGNALNMNFFKSFSVDILIQALGFVNNLKMAHYVKIKPRHTFIVQVFGTIVCPFIFTGILNFTMNDLPGFCTPEAQWKLTCPSIETFFTASVFWGLIGARRMFGPGGMYQFFMYGFVAGLGIPLIYWLAIKKWPRNKILRQFHPVIFVFAGADWSPYSMSFGLNSLFFSALSWLWLKKRYLEFWSKYNFVVAAALSGGVAISAFIQFWAVQYDEKNLSWWGNSAPTMGCEGEYCTLRHAEDLPKGYFGPEPGTYLI